MGMHGGFYKGEKKKKKKKSHKKIVVNVSSVESVLPQVEIIGKGKNK